MAENSDKKGGNPAKMPRGPLGDARPDAGTGDDRTGGGQAPEKVEDRPMVSTVKPEDYPHQQ
ncbi:hypothetical protein GRI97_13115 [Altererythrobacter xixiisoli]|uniref:Uncharacterized protein n=1 Tax=Croceibacterium xixiisoli TaxID=1476466 RepID=A0A6I4TYY6_9SPHN|nr:hypothetical protein [Croceibacterium xixiisoli]MXO99927.1 hypothetical protein [Croceibacterium xixiisoli]